MLHWVHWAALALALVYLIARATLSRNVARDMARVLKEARNAESGSLGVAANEPAMASHYRYQDIALDDSDVAFMSSLTDSAASALFEMNEHGFEGSAFEIGFEVLRARNTEWIQKNPLVFILARLPIGMPRKDGETLTSRPFFGYSAMVPLNDIGTDVYMRGLIKDRDLPASLICARGEPSRAILIFAVVLASKYRDEKSLAGPYLELLLRAVEHHAKVVAAAHAGDPAGLWLWTQSEHPSIVKHLRRRGFMSTIPPTHPGDGFEMLQLRLNAPLGRLSGASATQL